MSRGGRLALALALTAALLGGCMSARRPEPKAELPDSDSEVGIASYYASKFEGRLTANGERYRGRELTAAHRTLPFGTRIRVTHVASGRAVECRVNDRGPHTKGRIVDLSHRAAESLGILREGVARVSLVVLESP